MREGFGLIEGDGIYCEGDGIGIEGVGLAVEGNDVLGTREGWDI